MADLSPATDAELALSPAAQAELDSCPIGTAMTAPLPPTRLALRREIARHLYDCVKETDWWAERPAAVQEAFEKRPPWKFYMSGTRARRLFGVCEYKDGELGYHAITAMIMEINNVLGGIPADDDIVEVDEWPAWAQTTIQMCGAPHYFFDPAAWILLRD